METIKKRKKCPDCGWMSTLHFKGTIVPKVCPDCGKSLLEDPLVFLPIDKELNEMIRNVTRRTKKEAIEVVKAALRLYTYYTR